MADEGVTQTALADTCGVSQAHLSKVLNEKVSLSGRTAQALSGWVERREGIRPNATLVSIEQKLRLAPPTRRMQIMHLLRSLEQLIDQ
ncbi:helix-turn-helix domain-containing protein [Phenylobacterium sp.]|uniref:helix-turn-helix domain-containing protein n=1 Tax=Phenylobacterium sp. TaxID=1871053 RepID=UPI002730591D|nr:helix-turn-helix domain-containing protein [Phenylobacterium sp.]MDP1616521.1 helix-turn-helix domain-containing protein [Phenylobacterium sp.]MDP1985937.1 helix-turn-helix domain-containing protein [Phenylobacterium sp.]